MRFGWADPAVRDLCLSTSGLEEAAHPDDAADAQMLLQLMRNAHVLGHLLGLASVRLGIQHHPKSEYVRVDVGLGAASLIGVPLLNIEGRAVPLSGKSDNAVEAAEALYIEELCIHNLALNGAGS